MKPALLAAILAIAPLSHLALTPLAEARPCRAADGLPNTPSGRCARQFIALVNSPTPDAVREFETRWASELRLRRSGIQERMASFPTLCSDWGRVKLDRVDAASPLIAFVSTSNGEQLGFQFDMSATEDGKLDAVVIAPAAELAPSPPLSAAARAETVEAVASQLRSHYVFPAVGTKMADAILAKLASGDYDSITDERAFAMRLTDDCRAISKDKHLGIRPNPKSTSQAAAGSQRSDPRAENFGFKCVEILPGNIGYVRFDVFFESEEAFAVASSAMNFLAGADAIIFDLRHNGGGSPSMIRHITSYLFEERTHLNDMIDREGNVVSEYWTKPDVPGRRPRADVPVFVLTSGRTFSGAEEFSYNLQNLERAKIVGETTGGGAHPVRRERLNDRFSLGIPYMRARNPISKTNWEGTGVEPDVKVAADLALDKALELARAARK